MAHCAHLMQNIPPQTPPSPTPVIWAPLIQAPLQAAAATTSVAIALTHHPHLPPTLFRPPVSVLGSIKDPSTQFRKFQSFVPSTAPGSSGDSPSSTPSKLHSGVDMPLLAAFRAQHMTSVSGPTSSSQHASGNAEQSGPNGNGSGSSEGGTSVFPFGPFSSSGSPSSSTAQLHPQPQHHKPFRSSSPPLSNLFHQGSVSGSTGSGLSGGTVGACGGATGWSSGGAVGGSVEEAIGGDTDWAMEDFTMGVTDMIPQGHFGLKGSTDESTHRISGETVGGLTEGSLDTACGRFTSGTSSASVVGNTCGLIQDKTKRSIGGTSKESNESACRGPLGGIMGESLILTTTGESLGRISDGSLVSVSDSASGGTFGGILSEAVVGHSGGSLGRSSVVSVTSHTGGASSEPGEAVYVGQTGRVVGSTGTQVAGSTHLISGASGGFAAGLNNSSFCQSPLSTSSSSHLSGQIPYNQPNPKPPQMVSLQQFTGGSRTTSGINLFQSSSQGSPTCSRGTHIQQPSEGSPSSTSHFNLAGLQSGCLPHHVSLEKSALASLAQYGSANASPCLTPMARSPTVQSPVASRTFHYSEPSSVSGSHSSLLMPQSPLLPQLPNQSQTGRESPLGPFSVDLKVLSSSHPSLPLEVAQAFGHQTHCSSVEYYPSPFSSPTLVPKPYSSMPGRMTPPIPESPGHSHQTQSPKASPALPPQRGSGAYLSDLEPQTTRSKLPSNL